MATPKTKTPPTPIVRIEPIGVGRDDAALLLGIGLSTFEAHVSRGNLPRPRQLGGRAVWLVEELPWQHKASLRAESKFFGEAARAIELACEQAVKAGETTRDVGGRLGTAATGRALVQRLLAA